jgi:NitT/TauT family transport system permease protein
MQRTQFDDRAAQLRRVIGSPKKERLSGRNEHRSNPGWSTRVRWMLRAGLLLIVVGLWWIWGQGPIGSRVVGTPIAVINELRQWPGNPARVADIVATGQAASVGFVYGVSLGFVVAFATRFVPLFGRFLSPFIAALHAIPKVALGSAFIIAFGLGIASKVAFVVALIFFVIYFPIYEGLGDVPREVVRHARVIGVSRFGMLRAVYIPASLVWMATGLRLAVTFSILGAAAAEYLGSQAGVGHVIRQAMFFGDGVQIMAGVLVLSAASLVLDRLLVHVERRFSSWRLF